MKLSIFEPIKKNMFVALFHLIKNCTSVVSLIIHNDHVHIQGMDKSHVCLFNVNIVKEWFKDYEFDESEPNKFCIDTHIFHTIISVAGESHCINIFNGDDEDSINIELLTHNTTTNGDFNKFFKIPLIDNDYELLDVPSSEHDAEFSLSSRKMTEIVSQMSIFGSDLNIKCSEEKIDLITNGVTGEMKVNIPIDDLSEFSINEGETIDLKYSLSYLAKMCLTNKLSNEIAFGISAEAPMKIKYDLGNGSSIEFFIAPKILD
jgi:proliferating cell nuclear antigen PCNA